MRRVSDFAAQYLDPEDEEGEEQPIPARQGGGRRNRRDRNGSREATPFLEWVLSRQDDARARMAIEGQRSWLWLGRTIVAFIVSECPIPHWLGLLMFWVMIACGVMTLNVWREYRVARIQSSLWPD